jgi:hypothetical protein
MDGSLHYKNRIQILTTEARLSNDFSTFALSQALHHLAPIRAPQDNSDKTQALTAECGLESAWFVTGIQLFLKLSL